MRVGLLLLLVVWSVPTLAQPALAPAAAAYAEGELQRALLLLPVEDATAETRLLKGQILLELGRFEEASAAFKGLVRDLPHLRDLLRFRQGQALKGRGKLQEAADKFRSAARAKNSRWVDEAWRRRADALRLAGAHEQAAREYAHLIRIYPDYPDRPMLELHRARCLWELSKTRTSRTGSTLLRTAAVALREIGYRWPTHEAALQADQDLERLLQGSAIRLKPQPFWRQLQRIRAVKRGKRHDEAQSRIEALRRVTSKSADRLALDLEQLRLNLKRGKPQTVVTWCQERFGPRPPTWAKRRLVDALARLGRLDQALALTDGERKIRLLRAHGRFAEALKRRKAQVARRPRSRRKAALLELRWLAYLARDNDLAIEGFRHLARRVPAERPWAMYWEARAQARAGRVAEAEALYRQVMEKYMRTYYGLQARSRLVELGKLTLSSSSLCPPVPRPRTIPDPQTLELMDRLILRHGELYPSLRRARTLWEVGLVQEARRELRLLAIDFAWIQARGRPRWYIHRPEVERIWFGGKPERRRWNRRAAQIYSQRVSLASPLGELMQRAGIFFYGWRFAPRDSDPVRHQHPMAYPQLVHRIAKQYQLDPNLIWAVMKTESSFRTDVVSRAGAMGLMQIMPVTAHRIAAEMKRSGAPEPFRWYQLFVPENNLLMAGWYLRAVSNKFRGQLMLVAAAYNGGPHNVARWLDQRGRATDLDEFIEEIPFTESRRYAKKIFRLVALYERVHCSKDDRVASNTLDVRYSEYPDY